MQKFITAADNGEFKIIIFIKLMTEVKLQHIINLLHTY